MQFADIWGEAVDDGSAFGMPRIVVAVSADTVQHADFRAWLESLLDSPERRKRLTIVFYRGEPNATDPGWAARDIVGGIVTLNLPRIAYEARGEDELYDALSRRVRIAFEALAEKKSFLERLLTFGGIGPLAALTYRHGGYAYANPQHTRYLLGVTGLSECVRRATGEEPYHSPAALECAQRILATLKTEADRFSAAEEIEIVPTAIESEKCARRLARLDLQLFGESARDNITSDAVTRDATYRPGIGFWVDSSARDQIRDESGLLNLLGPNASTPVCVESSSMTPTEATSIIEWTLVQTRCGAMRFVWEHEQMRFDAL